MKIAGVRGSLHGLWIYGLSDSIFSNNSTAGRSAGSHLAAKAVGKPVYELFRLEFRMKFKLKYGFILTPDS